ncbi:MAG: RDD family protein [Moraxellaceae bacterium]|nr:RDD family protein [Moraxellaceae bacterium]
MNKHSVIVNPSEFVYLGFGQRVLASVIDTVIQMLILTPIVILFFPHLLSVNLPYDPKLMAELQWLFLAILTPFLLVFWQSSQSTLGKMVFHSKIVDAATGGKPTIKQFLLRFLGYMVVSFTLGIGFIWIIFDARKQGWHDKMANTVVIKVTPVASKISN